MSEEIGSSSLVGKLATVTVALCLAATSCYPDIRTVTSAEGYVDDLIFLRHSLEFPEHFEDYNAVRTGEEFDVNEYFSVLGHLAMEPGYVLDYVYLYEGLSGQPILYARRDDSPPYRTFDDYRADVGTGEGDYLEFIRESRYEYLNHVRVDGTPEGFFQFVLLRVMGRQFYRYWHAFYDDLVIVCDPPRLQAVLNTAEVWCSDEVLASVRREAGALDLEPTVEYRDDTVLVRVVVFTKWGGFTEERYTIARDFPHRVLDVTRDTLVAYDCGGRP